MLVRQVSLLDGVNRIDYAWGKINLFKDINYTSEVLIKIHGDSPRHRKNIKKQASQIRYCLLQAQEYFEASRVVKNSDDVYFSLKKPPMNEFGFLYCALYIVGNYARYFPDLWIRDLEQNNCRAVFVSHFLNFAPERALLLALSEFTRRYHLLRAI